MNLKFTIAAGALGLLASVAGAAETAYGISNGFGTDTLNQIYQINLTNGDLTNIHQVTLSGFTLTTSNALAADPLSGLLYAVVGVSTGGRHLITVDPNTGTGTDKGTLNHNFSSLAFKADGSLIGVTGDGDSSAPETLFSINKTNGSTSLMFALGNGADGETIAMHPSGLLYHSSGNSTALFESVDLTSQVVTPIGQASGEAFGMGWSNDFGQMFLSDIGSQLFTVNLGTGARTLVGDMSDQLVGTDNRGIAIVGPVPEPASLTAVGLGLVALARRRSRRRNA